jgi:hypothetical protein
VIVRGYSSGLDIAFLALQGLVVLFLLLHDWVPLGRLNNLAAMRGEDSLAKRIFVTLIPVVPTAVCLFFSAKHVGGAYPHWLEMTLWITYGVLLLGLLRAWWVPYLFGTDPERASRYRIIFAGTHSFLPPRNGMVPDTLHTAFHVFVLTTLVLLTLRGGAI